MDDADGWNGIASDYEKHATSTMKSFSAQAFKFANLSPNHANLKVIDIACGPGPMAEVFVENVSKDSGASLLATDFAKGMVDVVEEKAAQNGWTNVEATVMDAMVRLLRYSSCPFRRHILTKMIIGA
jgi:ubiquinone/menaquinone biosynthesis C-methylase UbiE